MSYLVLARKYRPQSFQDLVGQDHVARTLANAIASGRVAHAFLFTGVRGVGKTTSARLLAKCLNCVGKDGTAKGPTSTPCQECAPCKEIAAGSDIDVQEIDGASYNGVDEVRRLQEGIAFRPARDRFKIYIVDEVHMLSNAAWNAFLKTLEEPPPHVKFIFATTEVHKVPVTILSRCQRYDFKLIPTQVVAARLSEVMKRESIQANDGAVAVLAREAAGSMRDAMSLVDQVIAFSGDKLTEADVTRVLGVADRKVLHDLSRALVGGDAATALSIVDSLAQQGFDLVHVAKDMLRHLRDLVVAKTCGEGGRALLDLADEEVADVTALAADADADDLLRLFQGFSKSFDDVVRSGQPRTALEMTLVRLARRPALLPLDELLSRLGELERRLGGAPSPGPGAPRGSGSTGGGSAGGAGGSGPRSTGTSRGPASASSASSGAIYGALALVPPPAPSPEPVRAQAEPIPLHREVLPAPAREPPVKDATPLKMPTADLVTWRAILARVRSQRAPLASIYEHAVPVEITAERVLLGYQAEDFLSSQASEPEALELLQQEARAHFGAPTTVALDLSPRHQGIATVASLDAAERKAAEARARAAVAEHPLVREAIRVFGAELREVRLPRED